MRGHGGGVKKDRLVERGPSRSFRRLRIHWSNKRKCIQALGLRNRRYQSMFDRGRIADFACASAAHAMPGESRRRRLERRLDIFTTENAHDFDDTIRYAVIDGVRIKDGAAISGPYVVDRLIELGRAGDLLELRDKTVKITIGASFAEVGDAVTIKACEIVIGCGAKLIRRHSHAVLL